MRIRLILSVFTILLAFQSQYTSRAGDALALFSAYNNANGPKVYITDGTTSGTRPVPGIPQNPEVHPIRHKASLPGAAAITTAIPTSSGLYSLYLFSKTGVSNRVFVSKYAIDIIGSVGSNLYFSVKLDDEKRALYEFIYPSNAIRKLFELRSDRPENTKIFKVSNDICVLQSYSINSSIAVNCILEQTKSFTAYMDNIGIFQEFNVIGDRVILNCNGCELYSTETRPYVIDIKKKTVYPLFSSGSQLFSVNLGSLQSHVTFNVMGTFAYFVVHEEKGTYLWRTDGTMTGTKRISSFNLAGYEYWYKIKVSNGRLYILIRKYSPGDGYFDLLSTDGKTSFKRHYFYDGSFRVRIYRSEYEFIGNQIFFVGKAPVTDPATVDSAIYRADLLNGVATLLVNYNTHFEFDDINGLTAAFDEGRQFTKVGNRVIFMLADGEYYSLGLHADFFPWISDGRPQGTFRLKDADVTSDGYQTQEFAPLGPVPK